MRIRRGDIVFADLRPTVGCEQGGIRPVLIIQNNLGNRYSPTTIAIALTTKHKVELPTHVPLHKEQCNGLSDDSVILCEQIRTIDKKRIKEKIGYVDEKYLDDIMEAIKISMSIF